MEGMSAGGMPEGASVQEEAVWFRFYVFNGTQLVEDLDVLGARALLMQQFIEAQLQSIPCTHIWQHDRPKLRAVPPGRETRGFNASEEAGPATGSAEGEGAAAAGGAHAEPAHVGGCVRYGDNVEDEWVVISLLFALSVKFSDCILALGDNDGQVLLIEAAEELPKWLEPDTSDHRVPYLPTRLLPNLRS